MVKRFDCKITKDPYVFQQNRLDAHAEMKTLINNDGEWVSNRFLSLDGVWDFAYAKNYALAPKGFEAVDFDCRYWDKIKVPGHMQMQGYDKPHYTNTAYPWDSIEKLELGGVPEKFNPVGCYVKYFNVSEEYIGKRIRVSFQGVESGAAIWLNGDYVGYMENSFDPSDFDITPFIKEGENKLAVQVFKWTSGSWCEDQDFFRFSGIYRSVYLYVLPECHIEDVKIRTLLEDEYTKARVKVSVKTSVYDIAADSKKQALKEVNKKGTKVNAISKSAEKTSFDYYVKASLCDAGNVIATKQVKAKKLSELEFVVDNPKLWSAEKPNLYSVTIEILKNNEEDSLEQTTIKTGIREFKIIDGILCINGKRIVFKGVNRHEFSSRTGRAVSDEDILGDILTMKRNNINAIRTSHYPDDVRIYDLCDEYGLYMIAENNMETHGTWCIFNAKEHLSEVIPGDDMKWEPLLLDRVNSCYQRDKNHPAILMWSCGNESYGGPVIQHMTDKFKELDPDRPVHYEGIANDGRYPDTSDVVSRMYPPAWAVEEYLKKDRSKPFVLCEYSHAMGNSCGGIFKYTQLTDREKSFQGGFIWDFIDQSIYKKNRYGQEFLAYGGDFGDRPSDYNFSGNGIVYGGDRTPSPKMQEVKFCYQNFELVVDKKKIKIINKSLFTNSNEFDCVVRAFKNGKLICEKQIETNVAPLSTGSVANPLEVFSEGGEYCILASLVTKEKTKWCDIGHEVAFGQFIYKVKEKPVKKPSGYFEIIHGQQNISAKGDNFEIMFVNGMGGIVSYKYCGKEYINIVPKPNFWRAPTDNDAGNRMVARMAQWKIASLYVSNKGMGPWQINYPEVIEKKDSLTLIYTYNMPTTPASNCKVSYKVNADGRVDIEMRYVPVKELGDMPEFGMMYVLDADLCNLEWYGLGPEETYSDRCMGGKLGIYKNKVADNMSKYLVPQECGNKEGVRYALVTDECGDGLMFTSEEASFSALPFTPHEIENATHAYELPNVHHTVVRISKAQMGVGGDDSWGAPVHSEFHIDIEKEIVFNYSFKGIVATERN